MGVQTNLGQLGQASSSAVLELDGSGAWRLLPAASYIFGSQA